MICVSLPMSALSSFPTHFLFPPLHPPSVRIRRWQRWHDRPHLRRQLRRQIWCGDFLLPALRKIPRLTNCLSSALSSSQRAARPLIEDPSATSPARAKGIMPVPCLVGKTGSSRSRPMHAATAPASASISGALIPIAAPTRGPLTGPTFRQRASPSRSPCRPRSHPPARPPPRPPRRRPPRRLVLAWEKPMLIFQAVTPALATAWFDQCASETRVCVLKVVEIITRIILGDKTLLTFFCKGH